MIPLAVTCGLALGAGLAAAFTYCLPRARLDLPAALHHVTNTADHEPTRPNVVPWLSARTQRCQHPWLRPPDADLNLLELSTEHYVARRLRAAALGLTAGAALGALGLVVNLLPAVVAVLCAVTGAASGGMLPHLQVRETATERRKSYRRVLAVYLDLVAQERSAGRAATPALREAAETSDHPLFRRIHATVTHAHRLGNTPWDALRDLGDRLQVAELTDVADLANTAADGAAITTSLHTKATALRHAALTDDTTRANSRSEHLTVPATVLIVAFLGLALYPAISPLLQS
ncbi:pilus assembly protein TadB [Saccharopolyspora sp. HNM0986]|uniref:pilus assembly protein TadB n=1 Tax=Saccharopolyspora galaxeae TaxID=2781241 RepID=UPI00190BFF0A|nr:pilus assembly protein TadB [Saccharopolyspora sp. HNM0986]MBK0870213.1 pilus assembly protein TadB [Saccharopolyspora sp. HNM0986]